VKENLKLQVGVMLQIINRTQLLTYRYNQVNFHDNQSFRKGNGAFVFSQASYEPKVYNIYLVLWESQKFDIMNGLINCQFVTDMFSHNYQLYHNNNNNIRYLLPQK